MLPRVRLSGAFVASARRAAMPHASVAVTALPSPAMAATAAGRCAAAAARTFVTRSAWRIEQSSSTAAEGEPQQEDKPKQKKKRAKAADTQSADAAAPVAHDYEAEARLTREHTLGKRQANLTESGKVASPEAVHAAQAQAPKKERTVQPKPRVAVKSQRREQMSVESVTEKEVPLMDLTGLTPGQNKVSSCSASREQKGEGDEWAGQCSRAHMLSPLWVPLPLCCAAGFSALLLPVSSCVCSSSRTCLRSSASRSSPWM